MSDVTYSQTYTIAQDYSDLRFLVVEVVVVVVVVVAVVVVEDTIFGRALR